MGKTPHSSISAHVMMNKLETSHFGDTRWRHVPTWIFVLDRHVSFVSAYFIEYLFRISITNPKSLVEV